MVIALLGTMAEMDIAGIVLPKPSARASVALVLAVHK